MWQNPDSFINMTDASYMLGWQQGVERNLSNWAEQKSSNMALI